jgi:hypothetical protein
LDRLEPRANRRCSRGLGAVHHRIPVGSVVRYASDRPGERANSRPARRPLIPPRFHEQEVSSGEAQRTAPAASAAAQYEPIVRCPVGLSSYDSSISFAICPRDDGLIIVANRDPPSEILGFAMPDPIRDKTRSGLT